MSILLVLLLGCEPAPPPEPPPRHALKVPTEVDTEFLPMLGQVIHFVGRDVTYQVGGVEMFFPWFEGRFRPVGQYVDLDDLSSFEIVVDAAEVQFREQRAVDRVGDQSAMQKLELSTSGDTFRLSGVVTKLKLPFALEATPSVEEGQLVLDLDKARVLGVGMKPFLGAVGGGMDPSGEVVRVEGKRVVIDPFVNSGDPRVEAEFSYAGIEDGKLVARIGSRPEHLPSDSRVRLQGGVLKTGMSMLFGADLSLVPLREDQLTMRNGIFDEQMRAGHTKKRDASTLEVHVEEPNRAAH